MPPPSGSTIYEPTGYTPGDPVNLLLACHSAGRTSTDPFGTEGNACIASAQAAGYLCAASDAQNTAWGNAASVADYLALIAYCEATYNVTGIMLWGSSMGGLAALTMSGYLRGAKVRGALLVQPVCDLEATYNDHPAFQTTIDPAYSMTGYSAAAVGAYDPFDRPASEYADLRYRFYASPSDTYVSKVLNADAMAAKIASVALEADVVAVTGEHGDPSHWSWAAFEPFIARVFAAAGYGNTVSAGYGAATAYSPPPASITIDPASTAWEQIDTNIIVRVTNDPSSVAATVASGAGGLLRFRGTDADLFDASLDGTAWSSAVDIPVGETDVFLRVTPEAPGTTLSAEVGVPV